MPYDVFISYASADRRFADTLNDGLVSEGFKVWFDKARLAAGCDWHKEIEAHSENSRVIIPVLTPRWKHSEWTRYETYGAEAIIPLIFEGDWADVSTPPLEQFQAERIDISSLGMKGIDCVTAAVWRHLRESMPHKNERVIHLQHRANDNFVGRDQDLVHLHEELHCNPRAVLTHGRVRALAAMGGVGKTTLARHYAEKFWRCYSQMFWVNTRRGLELEFAEIHDFLFPNRTQIGLNVEDKAKRALHELNGPTSRLLILDNVVDEQSVTEWVPATGGCHTLITSRFAGWSQAVSTVHLDVLNADSAVEFLIRRTGNSAIGSEYDACHHLATELGYLPLALEHAAAYVKKQRLSFAEYIDIYDRSRHELLMIKALGSTNYPDSVITSLRPSIEKLTPGARAILCVASVMANTPIELRMLLAKPEIIIGHAQRLASEELSEEMTDAKLWIRNEIGNLVDYSLIVFDGVTFTLHPLLQAVAYETQSIDERQQSWTTATQLLVASAPVATWKIDSRDKWTADGDRIWERMFPHIKQLEKLKHQISPGANAAGFDLLVVNNFATNLAYSQAIEVCSALCNELEVTNGHDTELLLIEAKDCLAALLKQYDHYPEALAEFRALHQLRSAIYGDYHPNTLRAQHNVSCLMELLGDTVEAEKIMRDILQRRRQILGEEHYDTITSIHDLGWLVDRYDSRRKEAGALFQHAIELWDKTLGPGNPDSRDGMSNLATHLNRMGDYAEAIKIQRKLLMDTQNVLGDGHLTYFGVMHNLALFECNHSHDVEAHRLIENVVDGYRRYLPPNHRDMLTALQDLGTILARLGRYSDAEPLLREALAGYEGTQGVDTTDTLRTVRNLAGVLNKIGQSQEAERLNLRHSNALITKEDALPIELRGATHTYLALGDYDRAESCLERMLVAGFEIPGTQCHLARIYFLTDRDAKASEAIIAAWESREDAPQYILCRILFFRVLLSLISETDPEELLGMIKTAFRREGAHMSWDVRLMLEHLQSRIPQAGFTLLLALSSAIDDANNLTQLDAFPLWRDAIATP